MTRSWQDRVERCADFRLEPASGSPDRSTSAVTPTRVVFCASARWPATIGGREEGW